MTPTYTAEQLAAMSGVELSRIVAELCMGWEKQPGNTYRWWIQDGQARYIYESDWSSGIDFRPDVDHNHAAELRAKMVERFFSVDEHLIWTIKESARRVSVSFRPALSKDIAYFDGDIPDVTVPRASCIVAVLAAQALGGENA